MPFLVWLAQLSTSDVDCAIHEGTLQTDLKAVSAPLEIVQEESGLLWGFYTFNLDPKLYGCPCSRQGLEEGCEAPWDWKGILLLMTHNSCMT